MSWFCRHGGEDHSGRVESKVKYQKVHGKVQRFHVVNFKTLYQQWLMTPRTPFWTPSFYIYYDFTLLN